MDSIEGAHLVRAFHMGRRRWLLHWLLDEPTGQPPALIFSWCFARVGAGSRELNSERRQDVVMQRLAIESTNSSDDDPDLIVMCFLRFVQ